VLEAGLARLGAAPAPQQGNAPALSGDAVAAVQGMSEGDRNVVIRGMVERLAARLQQDGNDVEGWLRLARAYMVLNEPERARAARDDARRALATDEAGLRKLNDGLRQLGIDG
ncbi:MAG: c-type cytochrome biogenesis protein CcmI, partial [Xanthobacteraceae bacterium]